MEENYNEGEEWWQQYLNEESLENEGTNRFSSYFPDELEEETKINSGPNRKEETTRVDSEEDEEKKPKKEQKDPLGVTLDVKKLEKAKKTSQNKKVTETNTTPSKLYNLNFDQIEYTNQIFQKKGKKPEDEEGIINKGKNNQLN